MKKLILFLSPFIFILSFSFSVYAAYMPPTLPDFNTVNLPLFLEQGAQMTMVSQNGTLVPEGSFDKLNQLINGRTVQESLNYRYVDNSVITSDLQLFYNSNGEIVPQSQSYTVFGSSDIGDFACVCDKNTGEILYSYDEYENIISTLVMGGFYYDRLVNNPNANNQQEFNNQIQKAMDENLIVYGQHMDLEDIEFLSDYKYYCTYSSDAYGYTVYVPNACTSDTVVTPYRVNNVYSYEGFIQPNEQMSFLTPVIRTNNPSEVIYSTSGTNNFLNSETNSAYGYSFNYISNINVGSLPFWNGGYLDMNLPTQAEYAHFRDISDNAVYLQPAENTGEINNVYNYTYVTNDYTRPSPIINHNYDNRQDTNYYNYPVTNNVTYPDYSSTTNNYYEQIYNYYTTPNIGDSLGDLDDSTITGNIPILSNLRYRFPFSIPFDIYEMAKSFSVPRECPSLDLSFTIPVLETTVHCPFDLSEWDSMFALFRKLELILFVVGLAIFSYDHFFGT